MTFPGKQPKGKENIMVAPLFKMKLLNKSKLILKMEVNKIIKEFKIIVNQQLKT